MYDVNHLEHHGILGQKWGIRRFQNPDGTLTEAGKERYRGEIGEQDRKNLDTVRNKFRRSYAAQVSKNENGLLSYDQVRKAEKRKRVFPESLGSRFVLWRILKCLILMIIMTK